jgi:hypothetical protein
VREFKHLLSGCMVIVAIAVVVRLSHLSTQDNRNAETKADRSGRFVSRQIIPQKRLPAEANRQITSAADDPSKMLSENVAFPVIKKEQQEKKFAKDELTLNNTKWRWIKNLRAKSLASSKTKDFAKGYAISNFDKTEEFGVYNSSDLFIVSDFWGFEKRVVTGAIVARLTDVDTADEIAEALDLSVTYVDPQIKTAIFQMKDGQLFQEKIEQILASPGVKTAKLELLGRGVEPK